MRVELYELIGARSQRYSIYAWRTRMALAQKGVAFQSVPVRISDKAAIAFSGQDKVPILRVDDAVVADSWTIAGEIEARWSAEPSLFGGPAGLTFARFVNTWTDRTLIPHVAPMLMLDVVGGVDAGDAAHMRRQMEASFRKSLEEMAAAREQALKGFRRALEPARAVLRTQDFLAGPAPAYADHILFGLFQWARVSSPFDLLDRDDPIAGWRARLLDAYGGFARSEPAHPDAAA